jgi:biopolymer transport protein TolQ
LGRLIILGLLLLSVWSWILIGHKCWITYNARKNAQNFYQAFETQKANPLGFEWGHAKNQAIPNPFLELYSVLKRHTLEILNKNKHFFKQKNPNGTGSDHAAAYMTPSDVDFVQAHLYSTIARETKFLEKHLFILATIVSLAPFLGLLGTVWGILMTFAEMQVQQTGSAHNTVLSGISLALATTVMGLIDAIPALIGYNYLKNSIRDFQTDMEGFSNELLASVEIYYRKVES